MWIALLASSAWAGLTCEEVLFLVRSDVPRANILHTLLQAELEEGAAECLHRNGVPLEYIQAAVATPPSAQARQQPQPPPAPLAPVPQPAAPPAILRYRVDVEVVGLEIGVAKTNGDDWDGPGSVDPEKQRALLGMVRNGVPASTVASQVAAWGARGKAAPDPLGFVELRGPNTPEGLKGKRLPLDKRGTWAKDTYSPRFTRSYGFRGLTVGQGDALQITVQDMEFEEKETIGVAEIPFAQLARAFDAQQVTEVYVGDQTNGQLLYVLITVRPSAVEGRPEAVGPLY